MSLYYSLFSGLIYDVLPEEIKILDEGQVPLKKRPHPSCKGCYGRGFTTNDKERGIYPLCKCMKKCILDGYKPVQVKLLPKDS